MRSSPAFKFAFVLILFAGAVAITTPAAGPAQQAVSSKGYRSPGDRHKVQVRGDKLVKKMAKNGGRLIADYGAYQLWEANSATTGLVQQDKDAQVRDEDNLVRLNTGVIDTSRPEIQAQRKALESFSGKRLHLVQFAGPIKPEWYQALQATGVHIVTYIPSNAYLVWGNAKSLPQVQTLATNSAFVQWEGTYQDSYRIQPALAQRQQAGSAEEKVAIQLVQDEETNPATLNLIQQLQTKSIQSPKPVLGYVNVIVSLPTAAITQIATQPDVVSIQIYTEPKLSDERQDQIIAGNLTGNSPTPSDYLAYLVGQGFTQAQFTASGFAVDVGDTGLDNGTTLPNHPALYISGDKANASRVAYSRQEPPPDVGITGCQGHGNINAHIVGGFVPAAFASGFPHTDSGGFRYGMGVCPFVKVGSSAVFAPDPNIPGLADFANPDFEDWQSRAYRDGARISTNSWNNASNGYDINSQRFDALVRDAQPAGAAFPAAGNQEMVIVFSAGNSGSAANTVGTPGTAKNVITVGASENVRSESSANGGQNAQGMDGSGVLDTEADNPNDMGVFSSRGPTADGRNKPDLVAPGTHITGGVYQAAGVLPVNGMADRCFNAGGLSALPGRDLSNSDRSGFNPYCFFPLGQEWYSTSSGTSHSAPAVAGAAALVRQYFINRGLNPPSPAMTKAVLMNSARYLNGVGANDNLPSNAQGMGEANLNSFFDIFGNAFVVEDEVSADIFTASGQEHDRTGTVANSSKPFRVTLAWTDPPGPTSGNAFVNNLDLEVTVGGNTYRGNVFSGANSVTGGSFDTKNNVESVFIPAGVSGPFTVRVIATNIAGDGVPNVGGALDQDYALVIYNGALSGQPQVAAGSLQLTSEGCLPANNGVDPGETVTVNLSMINTGTPGTSNLIATLQSSANVLNPSGPQNYGTIARGGTGTRPFTFTASGSCLQTINLSVQLQDDSGPLGTVSFPVTLGGFPPTTMSNPTPINIVDNSAANPYPSNIVVSGLTGQVSKVTVQFNNLSHTYPSDIDALLVGPQGQTVEVMSGAGGGSDLSGVNLIFDDAASSSLPVQAAIMSGTYKPSNLDGDDTFPAPAPAPPHGQTLSVFNGTNPNGTWSLYVRDSFPGDAGTMAGGWTLNVSTDTAVCIPCPGSSPTPTPTPTTPSTTPPPGSIEADFNAPVVGTFVTATAVQPDGKIVIAGAFTSVLGVPRNKIARLNADGTLDASFDPNANNTVRNVAIQADGKVLLAGFFTTLQPNGAASATTRNRIARLNSDGTLDTGFDPNANSIVNSVAVQPDGKILLAGSFTSLQPNGAPSATTRNRIARINANGTLDGSFDPNANNQVSGVAVQADGKILLAGSFTSLQPNGAPSATARNRIARVNADGTLDAGFDPNANDQVLSVAVQADGKVLLAGAFTTLKPNGAPAATTRNNVARVNSDGTLDTGFDPNASPVGLGLAVYSLAVQADGKILFGGDFKTLQPNGAASATSRLHIARVNADGTLDRGFDPHANGDVLSITLQVDGRVVIGGSFTGIQPNGGFFSTPRNEIARLYNDTAIENLTAPDTSQVLWSRGGAAPEVSQVTFDSSANPSGPWTALGTATRVGTTANWQLTGLSLSANGYLRAHARTTNGIVNGGSGLIEQIAGYPGTPVINTAPSIAPLSSARQQGSAAVNTIIATVSDPQSSAVSLVVTATNVPAGLTVANIVNNNGTITADVAASCSVSTGNKTIVLQVSDGSLTSTANLTINVTANTAPVFTYNTPSSVALGASATVNPATASDNGTISFALQSQGTYTGTISVNSSTGAVSISSAGPVGTATITVRATDNCGATTDASFSLTVSNPGTLDTLDANVTGFSGSVVATAMQPDGKMIIAGTFSSVLGVTRNHIARLNADGTLDMTFDPNAAPTNAGVFSVVVQPDGKILIGGSFLTLQPNGAPSATTVKRLARLNSDGTLDSAFFPEPNANVNAVVVQPDGLILVGGLFSSIDEPNNGGPVGRNRMARLNADGTVDTSFVDPKGNSGSQVFSVALQTDGKILIGGTFTTLQPTGSPSAIARNRIARLNTDGTLDTGFDPNANSEMDCITIQDDGKILISGSFTTLQPNGAPSATTRNRIARLNSDGTLDGGFNPNASGQVLGLALQTDGRVLLCGTFTTLQPNGAPSATTRNRVARLNSDGTLDTVFNPNANTTASSVSLQPDGKILLGGSFTTLQPNGAPSATARNFFARLNNDIVFQNLTAPDTSQVLWSRGGAAPELLQTTFELSTDGGSSWTLLGNGTRAGTTSNWQLTGLSLPASAQLRARGRATNGSHDSGASLIEQIAAYTAGAPNTAPSITSVIGLACQQGTPLFSFIAAVTDVETDKGNLTVTAMSIPAGLSIANIANNNGTITADIAATCSATLGNNTIVLQVSDGSLTTVANLVINVTANSAPTLSYNSVPITYGDTTTASPVSASDNGSIASFALQSQGTYTGAISVNPFTGAVSISNAAPAGTHAISIRATDNCGVTTDAPFSLSVNRKGVTVTADGKVKVKGTGDPVLTYVSAGLVGNDTLAGTLSRVAGEAPGLHAITQGTVTDANNPNYTITFIPANLIITGPAAGNDVVTRAAGNASSLFPQATLLGNDIRIDSMGVSQTNNLSITGVTAGVGNSVSLSGANVLYSPNNAVATSPLTFTYTVTDSVSGATDVGTVTVNTIALNIVQTETATYDAGTDTTSITVSFSTLPNTALNLEYSIDLIGWVAYSGNPVNSSPTGSLVVTFTTPGDQTAPWNRGMFFLAAPGQ